MPDEDDFSQAYWMYVKKNQQSMAEKDPLLGVSTIFKQALKRDVRIGGRFFVWQRQKIAEILDVFQDF